MLVALGLSYPKLSILTAAIESREIGYAHCELKRLSVKLCERQFLDASYDILQVESYHGEGNSGGKDEYVGTSIESPMGADVEIMR